MFRVPTVFILGAGASWHYGYPTGEALVKRVVEKADLAANFFDNSIQTHNELLPEYLADAIKTCDQANVAAVWKKGLDEVHELQSGLEQVNPLVIDYYLGWNSKLRDIGRLLIAWVILECEYNSRNGTNANRPMPERKTAEDNWCRFITHQLAIYCRESKDLLSNRVSFITFNYDVSLERTLRNSLKHIKLFSDEDIKVFLSGSRIVHVYGRVRDVDAHADWPLAAMENLDPRTLTAHSRAKYQQAMKNTLDIVYKASRGLRVIDPHDKGTNDHELTIARTAIGNAKRIFILGYGFDQENSDRLNLREYLRHTMSPGFSSVAFTNYEDRGQVNKRASKVFYGAIAPEILANGHTLVSRYEKSVRNTYDALAWDFDLSE